MMSLLGPSSLAGIGIVNGIQISKTVPRAQS